jgi:hypothetical protein
MRALAPSVINQLNSQAGELGPLGSSLAGSLGLGGLARPGAWDARLSFC